MPHKESPLPKALQPAIKRAKLAIQQVLLNPDHEELAEIAQKATENADKAAATQGRRDWRGDFLMVPHYDLVYGNWYCNRRTEINWSIDKMPAWAFNGKTEPNLGETILGKRYSTAPKSSER